MKSRQMQFYFPTGQFFSILPKYCQVSKYAALLSEFSFPRKGKFWMVNLCNGGSKDFLELRENKHLKIWTHFSIKQTKLFWMKLKHYSQACSYDHLCRMTTFLRRPILSLPKQTPVQSWLYQTSTCLTRPTTTFLSPIKPRLKQPLKTFIQKRNAKQRAVHKK